MHFSKVYAQLLVTLPPELRNNAFEYRKLKKLINQTVSELDSMGLSPSVLQSLHCERGNLGGGLAHSEAQDDRSALVDTGNADGSHEHTRIAYEIALNASTLQPRLRLSSGQHSSDVGLAEPTAQPIYHIDLLVPEQSLSRVVRTLLRPPNAMPLSDNSIDAEHSSDLIIPLLSDTAFFHLLTSNLSSVSGQLDILHDGFNSSLATLAASISLTARPISFSAPRSFLPYSLTADNVTSPRSGLGGKSDLYTWRKIFTLYTEAEVFESVRESTRGERSVEEVDEQLRLFQQRIQEQKTSLILPGSREALDAFLNLNLFVLDIKKFQLANSEATRKILKKHAKLTSLPIPSCLLEPHESTFAHPSHQVTSIAHSSKYLPKLLVQAIGEVLLPIIPHIDDYSCFICTFVAFKPIRLRCGHFFCVRCLVKLQKRGKAPCPLCRALTVLQANRSNVDYGLLNFMADWFPVECREKQCANEREVTREQLEELGISDIRGCRIM